ncbi:DNA primase [Roseomonas marmotae]|uniref:DNA primase n=1 Tax=Roseomonas marmotae TaxID=2768161 RepID=A0ABS3KD34_9PROT|nr:DNA primase [Roseomonas marmotae]MBO1074840.1 DNA primase [Roseomonas marmotae]QTI80655.1 DNA primase [Roseomonas marmotae]
MALPPNFLEELRARTPLPALIGRKTRVTRSGRQWKACCPFHGEKTPSFYIYDDHYHCFGCGAHGDAIAFVMQAEGASFPEAVERLAAEAGLEVPKATPQQAQREARARDLHAVLEAAAEAFQRRLRLPEGRAGLDYLLRRGLSEETIRRFGLGWSGGGRGALAADLKPLGIELRQLVEAGLMRGGEDGGPPTDLFFNRVMFPIRDRRGRMVSFGGRTLGDGQPKYVNGPETALFSKRRNLYGIDIARDAAFRGKSRVVVAEGYTDVIALHQAGFTGAVAPLGTALTEEQLEELWRVVPDPVLCFDGDAAGTRAAARVATEVALPLLSTERTLSFVTLPPGEDPDSLIRKGGPGAFGSLLEAARPLSGVLYDMLAAEHGGTTPEARAGLRHALEDAAARISDKALASEYRRMLLDRFFESGRRPPPQRPAMRSGGDWKKGRPPAPVLNLPRPAIDAGHTERERLRCLLALTLAHPWLLPEVEEALLQLELPAEEEAARLRQGILDWRAVAEQLDPVALNAHLQASAPEALAWALQCPGLRRLLAAEAQPQSVAQAWWHFFGFLRGEDALQEDLQRARQDWIASNDVPAYNRMLRLTEALMAQRRGEMGDEGGETDASP